ncbi:MAG: hypothetical protein ACI4XA_01080 [Oscillospiraceae bacterium]
MLLFGICAWGVFGRLDTVVKAAAISENGAVTCYVAEEKAQSVQPGMTVNLNGAEYTVSAVSQQPVSAGSVLSDYALHVGELQPEEWVYAVTADGNGAPDGIYGAEIVVDSVTPKTFVIN